MILRYKTIHKLVPMFLISLFAMSTQAVAQVEIRPGTKTQAATTPATDTPSNNSSRRGGFGLSLDVVSLFKAVQSLTADDRYNSPDIASLPQYEPRQLIVSWPIEQQAAAQTMLQASGGTLLANQTLSNLGIGIAVIDFISEEQAALALPALQANPLITTSRHAIAYPMQSTGPVPGKQYAHELLKAPTKDGIKLPTIVTVGIIDTEVTNAADLNLANFKAKRIFTDADKPATPDHGNAVAAIIAGTGNGFEGLAQGTTMRAAGVMREVAPGINATNTLLVAQALDWMVGEKVQVVNLSLGSAGDAVLGVVVGKSLATGMVLIAAAGNGGPSAAPSYPAAYPGVIAVTAVDANKRLYIRANRGNYIAIAAPGVDVWVPVAAGGNAGNASKGKYVSGTSFASPFVAAAVAQSLATQAAGQSSLKTPTQIQKLCSKAVNLSSAPDEFGCGLLQM
jgi:subtilisin family serine protease